MFLWLLRLKSSLTVIQIIITLSFLEFTSSVICHTLLGSLRSYFKGIYAIAYINFIKPISLFFFIGSTYIFLFSLKISDCFFRRMQCKTSRPHIDRPAEPYCKRLVYYISGSTSWEPRRGTRALPWPQAGQGLALGRRPHHAGEAPFPFALPFSPLSMAARLRHSAISLRRQWWSGPGTCLPCLLSECSSTWCSVCQCSAEIRVYLLVFW